MPNGTYGGVRGKETKIGRKTFVSLPTRLCLSEYMVGLIGVKITTSSDSSETKDSFRLLSENTSKIHAIFALSKRNNRFPTVLLDMLNNPKNRKSNADDIASQYG